MKHLHKMVRVVRRDAVEESDIQLVLSALQAVLRSGEGKERILWLSCGYMGADGTYNEHKFGAKQGDGPPQRKP